MPMLSRIVAIITLLAFVLLSAMLQTTSPSKIHPIGILFVFILFYLLVLGVLTFLMYGLDALIARRKQATAKAMSFKMAYYYASVIALAPVLFIAMRSIGRSNPLDVVLILLFELVACFYISRRH